MNDLEKLTRLIRRHIVVATTTAGSGHPTSALSAVELTAGLLFGGTFRFFPDDPDHPNNDRLIFSKGHASPLLYALWAAAGKVSRDQLMTYRKFGSPLEGHPSKEFPYTEEPTGSLGQGLAIGFGMAMNAKYVDRLPYRTYVLLGDSEMAEGSQWESIQLAAHYGLSNLVGILDVNRLGQRGETMYGHDVEAYRERIEAFGWRTIVIDGHSIDEVVAAYKTALEDQGRPVMVIARTIKGKGVSFIEDKNGWHGKALSKDELEKALKEIGPVDLDVMGAITQPEDLRPHLPEPAQIKDPEYEKGKAIATREAYGNALARIFLANPGMVVLDAEVSNSTMAETFKSAYPDRFFEMFIAEQNMAGAALGFARMGKLPFMSSFSAFLSRAYDQIRMMQYAGEQVVCCGSHAGVSIGEDGPSQMGLEDLAMFRPLRNSVVLYPSDAISTERLVEAAVSHKGITYIRTTRGKTPIIYSSGDKFHIGGSRVHGDGSDVTIIGAGITLHEALKAREELKGKGVNARVVDAYSIKPLDTITITRCARETGAVITVEDHSPEGGLGELIKSALLGTDAKVWTLAVRRMPKSGKPDELLNFEEISSDAIVRTALAALKVSKA